MKPAGRRPARARFRASGFPKRGDPMHARPRLVAIAFVSLLALAPPCAPCAGRSSSRAGEAGRVLKPADNLVTDGLPEIPAAIAEAVGRYTEFRSAGLASLAPDEARDADHRRASATRPRCTRCASRWAPGASSRSSPTASATRAGRAARPITSSSRKDRGGDEFSQLYRFDVATGAITLLTDGGRSQNGLGPWSHQRRPDGLRLDAPERRGPRHLRDRPEGPGLVASAARASRAAAGASPTGRPTTRKLAVIE